MLDLDPRCDPGLPGNWTNSGSGRKKKKKKHWEIIGWLGEKRNRVGDRKVSTQKWPFCFMITFSCWHFFISKGADVNIHVTCAFFHMLFMLSNTLLPRCTANHPILSYLKCQYSTWACINVSFFLHSFPLRCVTS